MKNELFCSAVRDLLPAYAEGLASKETSAAIEEHIKGCDECRRLMDSLSNEGGIKNAANREIDYLRTIRRRSRRKVWIGIAATALMIAAILFLLIQLSAVLNIVDIVYSGDRSRALVIYDKDISGDSDMNSAFFVKQYNDLADSALTDMELRWFGAFVTQNGLNIIADGPYRGSLWSPDGSMFAINCGNGTITLDRLEGNNSPNIHYFISGLLKDAVYEQLGYSVADDSAGYEGVTLTALQWSEDSRRLLVNYVVTDTADKKHSGYLWYNCDDNTIYGLVENE